MSPTWGTGQTIVYGFCPGCRTLHRVTDCPDNKWRDAEYCICCEAISAEESLRRKRENDRTWGR